MQRTLIILKPDAVGRNLVGQVLARFEAAGLSIVELNMLTPPAELIAAHYPTDDTWLSIVGGKTLEDYEKQGTDPVAALGTADAVEIGTLVKQWLVEFMSSGPVVAGVLEGNRAIESVRKMVGATLPISADPGTIRGDYSTDSPDLANAEKRPVKNLIHASGDADEAAREIELWFG